MASIAISRLPLVFSTPTSPSYLVLISNQSNIVGAWVLLEKTHHHVSRCPGSHSQLGCTPLSLTINACLWVVSATTHNGKSQPLGNDPVVLCLPHRPCIPLPLCERDTSKVGVDFNSVSNSSISNVWKFPGLWSLEVCPRNCPKAMGNLQKRTRRKVRR